ncbi:MAG: FMN-binding protein MioC [Aliivibrio sp.]|uniref:FMN-binding protein MioC n=1 Tax=Aliivibrio sp. TaxID=1872443 RepID=UPI001A3CAACD|nr:FMN-binding protein MioC [Aliivibrio sp.]
MEKIQIITGSTLGGAEYVGDHLEEILTNKGINSEVHNNPNLENITTSGDWLLIVSTHGAGEYPDNFKPFIEQINSKKPDLTAINFTIIAIGDSNYDTYCAAGDQLKLLLEKHGAVQKLGFLKIDVTDDLSPEEAAEQWFLPLLN